MSTRIPLILATAPDLYIFYCNIRLHREQGTWLYLGEPAYLCHPLIPLIDVFSERYRELDSARLHGNEPTEEAASRLTQSSI